MNPLLIEILDLQQKIKEKENNFTNSNIDINYLNQLKYDLKMTLKKYNKSIWKNVK